MNTKIYDLVLGQYFNGVPKCDSWKMLEMVMKVINDLCDEELKGGLPYHV